MSDPFNVYITHYAAAKLNHYAAEALPTEIGGLAKLQFKDDDVFVMDVEMIKQRSSAAFFEIDSEDIGNFTRKMVNEGKLDEVPSWCSIVHSHPVGMGPSMSGVDVQQLKDFAQEEDAFSLIISADRLGQSKRMFMHYCADIRGRKVMYQDIPVKLATTTDRYELSKRLQGVFSRFFTGASEADAKILEALCDNFCTETVPGVLPSELEAIKAEAKRRVPELVSHRTPLASTNNYRRHWQEGSNPTGFQSPAPVSHTYHSETVPKVDTEKMTPEDRVQWYRDAQLANGYDPRSRKRDVTTKGKRKASDRLKRMAAKYTVSSLPPSKVETTAKKWEAMPGDIVLLKDDAVTANSGQAADQEDLAHLLNLTGCPSYVSDLDDKANCVIVDGFMFYQRELDFLFRPSDEELDPELAAALDISDYLLKKALQATKSKELVIA